MTSALMDAVFYRWQRGVDRKIEELQRLGPPRVYEALVTTSNATPTVIYSFGTASNVVYQFYISIVGIRTDVAGNTGSYQRTLHVKNIGGTVTIGAFDAIATFEDNAAWDVTAVVNATNIDLKVTGVAGQTINWKMRASLDQNQ